MKVIADETVALQSGKDTAIKAKGAATVEASKDLTLFGQNMTAESKQNLDIKGGTQTNVGNTKTFLKGAAFNIELK
ncbi:hypothetical protein DMA11_01850 [Marinilabiliaceae bacterium JC017]|nr:hypothetical protein DMA11_01850 [Marinilabiliaceae bacterium JC017]